MGIKTKVLLGANRNWELVFGEFSLSHPRYCSKEKGCYTDESVLDFSASFDVVRPFNSDDYDLEDYFEEWQEGLDKEYLYDQCVRFNCKPSELAKELANECYDIRDALDCSLYPECYEVDGESWYFESVGCGQYDSRKDGMEVYTNKNVYDKLHKLWDEYHLKRMDNDIVVQVENLAKMCEDIQEHEEEWIVNYIRENMIV